MNQPNILEWKIGQLRFLFRTFCHIVLRKYMYGNRLYSILKKISQEKSEELLTESSRVIHYEFIKNI